jgi:hypothetical protein
MRVPQVSERFKEVPAQALRGVFAGIGQLLLITDKLRNKPPADAGVPRARTPQRSGPDADATAGGSAVSPEKTEAPASAPPAGAKPSSVKSAPVKPDTAKATAAKAPPTAAPKPARTPRIRDFDKTGNVRLLDNAETSAAHAAGSEPIDSSPPLPNYDELSVASLRARLRNLDVGQVRRLAEYERANAARADVIAMFERRIAKLEAGA